jgi:hypothetical protein
VVLAALLVTIVRSLTRGEFGLDIIAALAMGGSLAIGEPLAGIVVALMLAGGQVLEDYAQARARREMTALLSRVPRTAQLYKDQSIVAVPLDDVRPGDRLLVRPGDVVPVDGHTLGEAVLDQSALTGESLPGSPGGRPGGDERQHQCGRGLRSRRRAQRGPEHLCRHRPPGRGGAKLQGADGAPGRSLRLGLSGPHDGADDGRLSGHRRTSARAGGSTSWPPHVR